MRLNKTKPLLAVIFVSFVLGACGGGSGSDSNNANPVNVPAGATLNAYSLELSKSYEFAQYQADNNAGSVYYPVQLTEGKTYTVYVDSSSASTGTMIPQLMDNNFAPLTGDRENWASSGGSDMVVFDYKATRTGIFYIKSVILNPDKFARYTLTVYPSVDNGLIQDSVTYEPNNSFNTAYLLKSGDNISSVVSGKDNTDFYRIEVKAGQKIDLTFTNLIQNYNSFWVKLYDAQQQPLTGDIMVVASAPKIQSWTANYTGSLYINVNRGFVNSYSFNYLLSAIISN
jgi:hypothetical protein